MSISENNLTNAPSVISPVVVDLLIHDEEEIRSLVKEGLSGPSPMFAIKNYGFESLIKEVRQTTMGAKHFKAETETSEERCISCELQDELSLKLKKRSKALVTRLSDTLFGPEFRDDLKKKGETLDGRQSMRYYAGEKELSQTPGETALGPHVDATLFTMLWSDGPGLQVLNSSDAAKTDVTQFGVPSIGPSACGIELKEEDWSDVGLFWEEDLLLVTVGQEWIDLGKMHHNGLLSEAKCAALHRVRLPPGPRCSFPFLVRVVSIDESERNVW